MRPTALLDLMCKRRSIREYSNKPIIDKDIISIIEAARWAPSGLNNQPWRFVIIKDADTMAKLASLTKYSKIVKSASVLISVFLDTDEGYNRDKDLLAVGASIQNMLLMIESLGLGACWLGEILNQKGEVAKSLETPDTYELMAVLAIGHPKPKTRKGSRVPLSRLIYKEII